MSVSIIAAEFHLRKLKGVVSLPVIPVNVLDVRALFVCIETVEIGVATIFIPPSSVPSR